MSTLPALLEALAPHDGRSVASLKVVAIALREAGLISLGSRGGGAIHMSAEDAASLTLASLWTDSASASPRAVEMLSGLRRKPRPHVPVGRFVDNLSQLTNFGEMVAALIEYGRYVRAELGPASLLLTVDRPIVNARLEIVNELGCRRTIAEWGVDAQKLMKNYYLAERLHAADRRHSSAITSETLFALADCIAIPEREDA